MSDAQATSSWPYAARVGGISGSVIDSSTSLLQGRDQDIVRFAMGSPAPDAIPIADLRRLLDRVLTETGGALDYGPTEGESVLRDALCAFLVGSEGAAPEPDSLLITAGGMQGLDLACKLFVEAGDLVVTEAPTYTNGTATITGYEGQVVQVPIDDDGMQIDYLEGTCRQRGVTPKLIYTVPTFQNPSGTTMSLERRRRLAELAGEWDAVILEDDPYAWLRFQGDDLPSIADVAPAGVTVIGVRTFSKVLAPGLRVGWLTADPPVIERMIAAKQSMDTCTSVPMQKLVAAYLAEGQLGPHLDRLRSVYGKRKRVMQAALRRHFGDFDARWTDPSGGFFIWLELPRPTDTERMFSLALDLGVAFIPGSAFSLEPGLEHALRLCFATQDEERTETGVARLRQAFDRAGAKARAAVVGRTAEAESTRNPVNEQEET